MYDVTTRFNKFYASWWQYMDIHSGSGQDTGINQQLKWWALGNGPHHGGCGSMNQIMHYGSIADPNDLDDMQFEFSRISTTVSVGSNEEAVYNAYTTPTSYPPGNRLDRINVNRGGATDYDDLKPTEGAWSRVEIYAENSSGGVWDGSLEIVITRATGAAGEIGRKTIYRLDDAKF